MVSPEPAFDMTSMDLRNVEIIGSGSYGVIAKNATRGVCFHNLIVRGTRREGICYEPYNVGGGRVDFIGGRIFASSANTPCAMIREGTGSLGPVNFVGTEFIGAGASPDSAANSGIFMIAPKKLGVRMENCTFRNLRYGVWLDTPQQGDGRRRFVIRRNRSIDVNAGFSGKAVGKAVPVIEGSYTRVDQPTLGEFGDANLDAQGRLEWRMLRTPLAGDGIEGDRAMVVSGRGHKASVWRKIAGSWKPEQKSP
jgi:hypothetical protein